MTATATATEVATAMATASATEVALATFPALAIDSAPATATDADADADAMTAGPDTATVPVAAIATVNDKAYFTMISTWIEDNVTEDGSGYGCGSHDGIVKF